MPDGMRLLGTVVDITDRKHAETALREAKNAAEHHRQEQQIGFVPVDRQVLLVGATPAAPTRCNAAPQETA
jgi:hypothetical protein